MNARRQQQLDRLEDFERRLEAAVADAVRHWLGDVARHVLQDGQVLTAANLPDNTGWNGGDAAWQWAVRQLVSPLVGDLFGEAFQAFARAATSAVLPWRLFVIEQVESRLRLFPAEQFEQVRMEVAEAISEGEDINAIRDRIGAFLNFDATAGAAGEQAETRRLEARIGEIERVLDDPAADVDAETLAELRRERASAYEALYEARRGWQWKARRIARTEAALALNGGTYYAALTHAEASGEPMWKQWMSTADERTRPTHVLADGQAQVLTDSFDVGGFPLLFPADPAGPGHETINCRCVLLVLDRDELTEEGLDPDDLPAPRTESAPPAAVRAAATDQPHQGEPVQLPTGWRGTLAPLDTRSGDGRIIATPGELRVRQAPRALLWQRALSAGHDGAEVAGRIDRVWIEGGRLQGEGPFDLASEAGAEAARQLAEGFANGISVDLDDMEVSEQWIAADGSTIAEDDPRDWDELMEDGARPVMAAVSWRLMTATLVSQPAFDEARIEPVYDYAPAEGEAEETREEEVVASGGVALVASSGVMSDVRLPGAAFADPCLSGPTPLTVSEDGRVFGHLATWGTCHIGFSDVCVTPPRSATDYALFHVGEVLTSDGSLPVGKITLGTGHAESRLGAHAAAEHYDHTGTVVAVVRAGEDAHGIWVAGLLTAGVTGDQIAELRRSPLSGDWRRVNGRLELVAALCVNVPGFPIPRAVAASAAVGQLSLVAAGTVRPVRGRRKPAPVHVDYEALAQALVREQTRHEGRSARAEAAARRLGRDPESRITAAAERLGL